MTNLRCIYIYNDQRDHENLEDGRMTHHTPQKFQPIRGA
jgi:hypothetical protein